MYKIDGEASEESINLKKVIIRLYTYEKCKFSENNDDDTIEPAAAVVDNSERSDDEED